MQAKAYLELIRGVGGVVNEWMLREYINESLN